MVQGCYLDDKVGQEDEVDPTAGSSSQAVYDKTVHRMGKKGNPGKKTFETKEESAGLESSQVIVLALMQLLKNKSRSSQEDHAGGPAVRRLQEKFGIFTEPVLSPKGDYLFDITERLGADRGDAMRPWTWTEKAQWGELAGVHRVHSHLSRVLALLLKGRESKGEAYIVQLLQSLRQVSLDGGV